MSASSSWVRLRRVPSANSSRCLTVRVPGIGMMLSPWCNNQAIANPDALIFNSPASFRKLAAIRTFRLKLGSINRGFSFRKSMCDMRSVVCGESVNNDLPTGEKATRAVPEAFVNWVSPISGLRVESEYSDCTAATCPTDCASFKDEGAISENP